MKCREIQRLLPEIIEKSTLGIPDRGVSEHLAKCSACASFADDLRRLFDARAGIKQDQPADHYWSSILPRIHDRIEAATSRPTWIGNLIPAAITLGIVLVLILVPQITQDPFSQSDQVNIRLIPDEELQSFMDQQATSGYAINSLASDDQELMALPDKESIVNILSDTRPAFSVGDEELYYTSDGMSDGELKNIVSTVDLETAN